MTRKNSKGPSKPRVVGSSPAGRVSLGLPTLRRHLTVNEYAALRGMSPRDVRRQIHAGPLNAFRMGGRLFIEASR